VAVSQFVLLEPKYPSCSFMAQETPSTSHMQTDWLNEPGSRVQLLTLTLEQQAAAVRPID
jgi:hypothetical protein